METTQGSAVQNFDTYQKALTEIYKQAKNATIFLCQKSVQQILNKTIQCGNVDQFLTLEAGTYMLV